MTTRRRQVIIDNFAELTLYLDYSSEEVDNFSEHLNMTTIIGDNTNPFADDIIIGDKVGNNFFTKATTGLEDDEKLNFDLENAQVFKDEMDNANANFVWGPVTFAISDSSGNMQDLMEEYDLLTIENVIEHAKTIWNAGADYKIPVADEHLTKKQVQLRICLVMMSKFIRNSLTKAARKVLDLNKKNSI